MENSLDILEVKQVLFDLVVVLSSDSQSELYMKSFAHIDELIKRMSNEHKSNTSISLTACDIITNDDSFVSSSDSVIETNCDESDLLYMCPDSSLLLCGNGIYESEKQAVLKSLSEYGEHVAVNKFYSSLLLDKLIKLYLPTLPLKIMIMFGKSGVDRCSNFLPPRTTGSQEQRCTIFKKIILQGGKALRIDDFTYTFHKFFLAMEKDHIALYLHNSKKIGCSSNMAKKVYQKLGTSRMCKI